MSITTIVVFVAVLGAFVIGLLTGLLQRVIDNERHLRRLNSIDNADLQCAKSAVKRLRPTQLAAIGIVARSPMNWPGLMAFCRMHHVESELARKHKRAA